MAGTDDTPTTATDPDSGSTVLITGASSGIGEATARRFLEAGWTVYATARDRDDVEDLAADGCHTAALDVTDPRQPREVVDRIVDETGRLDCLVNNAGFAQRGTIEDVPPRKVRHQFDVNLFGPHRLMRAVLPHMRAADGGAIVNVSSFFGRISSPGMGVYAGSKVALEAFSDAVRAEVADQGVNVVIVEPGPVETNFESRTRDHLEDVDRSGVYADIYEFYDDAGRLSDAIATTPDAVADVIYNAAETPNPSARYTVGAVARLAVRFRFLPDRWRDGVYRLLRRIA
ncbi:MAG: SDR family oxidoreductase [Halobacteriaceae archaeon]